MRPPKSSIAALYLLALALCLLSRPALGQQEPVGQQTTDDVLRVNTELVQAGVMVFDKQGRFVEGLKKEDFELSVDGRPAPITFFENIAAGSQRDRLARAALGQAGATARNPAAATSYRQRTIIFFLDDRHLSLDSLNRTRKAILDFIDKQMGNNDLVAIASSSGQVGFLQQFTDNKEVLRAAVDRMRHIPYDASDYGRNPSGPMTEFMALTIERRDDPNVFEFFVQDCMLWAPKGSAKMGKRSPRTECETDVKNRARQILLQANTVTNNTYVSLETFLRSAARMPGSKLAFFISDGFLADTGSHGSVSIDRLGRITDEARRAGVVFYTVDARGLLSGGADATGEKPFDPSGRLESANMRAIHAYQDALHSLAVDTGGRAVRNQNYFTQFVGDALTETSRYYLIAWRPESDAEKDEKVRKIKISVVGRPELVVRSARGFVGHNPAAAAESAPDASKASKAQVKAETTPDTALGQALSDFYPKQGLPVQLSLTYLDTPASGPVLTSSVQIPTGILSYGAQEKEAAQLTLAGVVLNDQGKPVASFKKGLKVDPTSSDGDSPDATGIIFNYPSPLKPGIYQVRVAARDDRSGTVGSAMHWAVIPDLSTRQLSLSSIILGINDVAEKVAGVGRVQWSVDKRFAHGSRLRFMNFIYNAVQQPGAGADLLARVQIYKDGQVVLSTPFKKVKADPQADPSRIPYTGEINLGELQGGRYVLEVMVEDHAARRTSTQQAVFYVQ